MDDRRVGVAAIADGDDEPDGIVDVGVVRDGQLVPDGSRRDRGRGRRRRRGRLRGQGRLVYQRRGQEGVGVLVLRVSPRTTRA